MTMYTSTNILKEIAVFHECLRPILEHLGKTDTDDEQVPIVTVLDVLGCTFAFQCLAKSYPRGNDALLRLSCRIALGMNEFIVIDDKLIEYLKAPNIANFEEAKWLAGLGLMGINSPARRGVNSNASHMAISSVYHAVDNNFPDAANDAAAATACFFFNRAGNSEPYFDDAWKKVFEAMMVKYGAWLREVAA